MAAQRHCVSVMELLIKHGADINDTNKVFAYRTVGNLRGGLNFVYFRGP